MGLPFDLYHPIYFNRFLFIGSGGAHQDLERVWPLITQRNSVTSAQVDPPRILTNDPFSGLDSCSFILYACVSDQIRNWTSKAQKNRISARKACKYGWYTTEFGSAQAPKENMNIQKWEMVIFHIYSIKRLLNGEIISEIFKKSSRGVETREWFWGCWPCRDGRIKQKQKGAASGEGIEVQSQRSAF